MVGFPACGHGGGTALVIGIGCGSFGATPGIQNLRAKTGFSDTFRLGCAHRKISSKGCGEKIQPQINANERKSIPPPLGVLSGVHSKSTMSWVLGLWSPCARRLCASSWPSTDLSQVLFGSLRPFAAKKKISSKPNDRHSLTYDRLSLYLRVSPRRFRGAAPIGIGRCSNFVVT